MRTPGEERILSILAAAARKGYWSVTLKALARRLSTNARWLAPALDRLERDGLVEQWSDARRNRAVCLTTWAVGLFDIQVRSRTPRTRKGRVLINECDLSELDTIGGRQAWPLEDVRDEAPPIELHGPEPKGLTEGERHRFRRATYSSAPLPRPAQLLGTSMSWPLAPVNGYGCPTCLDDPPPLALCLNCHRFPAADAMLGKPARRRA